MTDNDRLDFERLPPDIKFCAGLMLGVRSAEDAQELLLIIVRSVLEHNT